MLVLTIVFFTGHNPKLQKMALFVIPGDNGYISTNNGQNALKILGAVKISLNMAL